MNQGQPRSQDAATAPRRRQMKAMSSDVSLDTAAISLGPIWSASTPYSNRLGAVPYKAYAPPGHPLSSSAALTQRRSPAPPKSCLIAARSTPPPTPAPSPPLSGPAPASITPPTRRAKATTPHRPMALPPSRTTTPRPRHRIITRGSTCPRATRLSRTRTATRARP